MFDLDKYYYRYFTKRNLTAALISSSIIIFAFISFFIWQMILNKNNHMDEQMKCLTILAKQTDKLRQTLCKDRGYELQCDISWLPEQDLQVFINFYEIGKQKCQEIK